MLGYGAAAGEMHAFLCDESWKYVEEIFSRAFLKD